MTYQPPPPGGGPPPYGPRGPGRQGPGQQGSGQQGPGQQGFGRRHPGPPGPGGYGPPGRGPVPPPGASYGRPPFVPGQYGPHGPGGPGFGGPPGPPPRPPRNTGVIVAWVLGGVAVVAVIALVVTVVVTRSSSDDSVVAGASTRSSEPTSTSSDPSPSGTGSEPESADSAALTEIRAALLAYITARNARDVGRMRAAVCTQSRDRITGAPPSDGGDIILDGFLDTVFDGDVAQSEVVSHLEKGTERTASEKSRERFLKEQGSWIYCPDAEPDIGA